jgi:glycine betaine/proline transport system substrate-binding protein
MTRGSIGVLAPVLGVLAVILLLLAGCGAEEGTAAGTADEKVVLGYVDWEESVAMAQLTKVILEDELGYENVQLRRSEPDEVYRLISQDDVDAFQGAWLPNHFAYIREVDDDVSVLRSWLDGVTRQSIAVPDYMGIRSVEELEREGVDRIIGPKPGSAAVVADVPVAALARYGVGVDLTYPSAEAMLEEVDRLYKEREPFAFVAWTPHWMNVEYDFEYLEDPEDRIGGLIKPMDIHTAIRKELPAEDPVAHDLMEAMELGEYQMVDLQEEIRDSSSPEAGARNWTRSNEERIKAWVKHAEGKSTG